MKKISPIFSYIAEEKNRQQYNIELIASENYVSEDVLEAQGSILTNKYAEGYPSKRYYEGCEFVDKVESYAQKKLKELFNTDYSVNVQPHSGSSANMAVYLAVLKRRKRKIKVLGMSLDAGGHLTHWATPSFSGKKYNIFDSYNYGIDEKGYIDIEEVRKKALEIKPDLIIAWASAYSRKINFQAFKDICDEIGAFLLVDMAHIAGLVATWLHPTPFGIADFVTSTTHKTLRGPRGWIILSKTEELGKDINSAIFPWIQWGPLVHIIAAKAICFEQACTNSYQYYMEQVVKNAKKIEEEIKEIDIDGKKINIISDGTDNHLLLLDFREIGLSGKQVEYNLERVGITTNKNSVPGDANPVNPSGLRIGTPAITSRGCDEEDMVEIVKLLKTVIAKLYFTNEDLTDEDVSKIKTETYELMKNKSLYPEV